MIPRYGYEIGDRALKAVARWLATIFKGRDNMLSRLGGKELTTPFPIMDSNSTTKLSKEIRSDISRSKVTADDEDLGVTISIGVAQTLGHETFKNHLNTADQFLYITKHKGRNMVYSDAQVT